MTLVFNFLPSFWSSSSPGLLVLTKGPGSTHAVLSPWLFYPEWLVVGKHFLFWGVLFLIRPVEATAGVNIWRGSLPYYDYPQAVHVLNYKIKSSESEHMLRNDLDKINCSSLSHLQAGWHWVHHFVSQLCVKEVEEAPNYGPKAGYIIITWSHYWRFMFPHFATVLHQTPRWECMYVFLANSPEDSNRHLGLGTTAVGDLFWC